jgi:FkbM family methyltransferase
VRFDEQYFEDFLDLREEVFVDAGGFDGDTTEQFCRRVPDYRRVHFFEPSPINMARARQRLAAFPRIDFRQVGVSDVAGTLQFDPGAGSASAVSAAGTQTIEVDRLDDLVEGPVSFLKMDLEGWELHALRGAARTIRQQRPKLAIAVSRGQPLP